MKIYIFKGSDGEKISMNEISAHNEIRNKGQWQRQDLVYLGVADNTKLAKDIEAMKNTALNNVIDGHSNVTLQKQKIELAKLTDNDNTQQEIKRLELELSIIRGEIGATIKNNREFVSIEVDKLINDVTKEHNRLAEEAFECLELDPKTYPRDFSSLTSNFGGEMSEGIITNNLLR